MDARCGNGSHGWSTAAKIRRRSRLAIDLKEFVAVEQMVPTDVRIQNQEIATPLR